MKTYEILVNGRNASDYIKGRISGIIYALSGMSEKQYCLWEDRKTGDMLVMFDATEEQSKVIHDCLNNNYPKAYMGIKEHE